MTKNDKSKLINLDDFAAQKSNAQSPLQEIVRSLAREVNRHKLDYHQLKYIFKAVRAKCAVEVPRAQQALLELPTNEELNSFFKTIKNPIHSLLFETLLNTGLRVAELCVLEVRRIDFEKNTVLVIDGKGGKDRTTVFGNKLKGKLLIYLQGKNNRYLFESERNSKYSTRRIQQLCEKYQKAAAIEKDLTCHTFRHVWNTRLAEAGISREGREILAGHSKGSATQDIYTHMGVGGIKSQVIDVLDRE